MFLIFLIERDQESSTISRSSVSSLKKGMTGTPIGGGMGYYCSESSETYYFLLTKKYPGIHTLLNPENPRP